MGDCDTTFELNFAHDGPLFAIWHRNFMLWLERQMRVISDDHNFALPYWDWIAKTSCQICTNSIAGAINKSSMGRLESGSPFSQWETVCFDDNVTLCGLCDPTIPAGPLVRNLSGSLPTVDMVQDALDKDMYAAFNDNKLDPVAFRAALEHIHDTVNTLL